MFLPKPICFRSWVICNCISFMTSLLLRMCCCSSVILIFLLCSCCWSVSLIVSPRSASFSRCFCRVASPAASSCCVCCCFSNDSSNWVLTSRLRSCKSLLNPSSVDSASTDSSPRSDTNTLKVTKYRKRGTRERHFRKQETDVP